VRTCHIIYDRYVAWLGIGRNIFTFFFFPIECKEHIVCVCVCVCVCVRVEWDSFVLLCSSHCDPISGGQACVQWASDYNQVANRVQEHCCSSWRVSSTQGQLCGWGCWTNWLCASSYKGAVSRVPSEAILCEMVSLWQVLVTTVMCGLLLLGGRYIDIEIIIR
jgi:hypothetical protein